MPAPREKQQPTRVICHALLGCALAAYLACFLIKGVGDIRCPYSLDYGEGVSLYQALRLANAEGLYSSDYRHYPFVFSLYTPLYVAVTAVGVKLWGAGFAFGRSFSILASLAVAGLMVLLLRRAGARWAPSLGAPAFLLATYWYTLWGSLMRLDPFLLVLGLAGLYCTMRGGRRWLVAAGLCFLAATYTKQSAVAALAAACLYLWSTRQRRAAVALALSWAGAALLLFAVFQWATAGGFYRHVVAGVAHPWYAARLWMLLGMLAEGWPVLVAGGAAGAAMLVAGWPRDVPSVSGHADGRRLLLLYLLCGALASITAGKVATTFNHLFDLLVGLCLVAGLGYDRLLQAKRSTAVTVAWSGAVVALAWQLAAMWVPLSWWPTWRQPSIEGGRAAARRIAETKGEIIGEPIAPLVLAGRPVLLEPATASHVALGGGWDQTPLLQDIRRQRFALIYMSTEARNARPAEGLYASRWTKPMMAAILANYRDAGQAGNICFLTPRPAAAQPRPSARLASHRTAR